MGVSEVLLCPYRCLEYKMERLEKLKIAWRINFLKIFSSVIWELHFAKCN